MMEVVHDMAPKAQLAFATGMGSLGALGHNLGMVSYLHAIDTLAFRGCTVIADDIQYMEEPAFETQNDMRPSRGRVPADDEHKRSGSPKT